MLISIHLTPGEINAMLIMCEFVMEMTSPDKPEDTRLRDNVSNMVRKLEKSLPINDLI